MRALTGSKRQAIVINKGNSYFKAAVLNETREKYQIACSDDIDVLVLLDQAIIVVWLLELRIQAVLQLHAHNKLLCTASTGQDACFTPCRAISIAEDTVARCKTPCKLSERSSDWQHKDKHGYKTS